MNTFLRSAAALMTAAIALASAAGPALARDSYVQDGAGLFSAATVSGLNQQIGDFERQTGKEILVVTVPSYDGALNDAVERTFAAQQVNGVLFFFGKAEQQDAVVGDNASQAFFPSGAFTNIHDAMRGYLRGGDFDQAIKTGVSLVIDGYRSHETSMAGTTQLARVRHYGYGRTRRTSLGGGMSLFWFILILLAGFMIIRALFRAASGPRMMPPGYGQGGPGSGPGYGGGYGPGYGYGGGGGFFSGLLGGLGGAFLGNELFGNHGGQQMIDPSQSGVIDGGSAPDASGFQPDAGQPDMGNMGGGGWGDSGGGFDPSGGGGDFGGGGGGFDAGGGGGW